MARHTLILGFPDYTAENVLCIDDLSVYNGLASGISGSTSTVISATCANLQITSPGFSTPTSLQVIPTFRLVLNACTLGITASTSCADGCPDIPDGMYNIRYSVSPNDQVYVEYKILRIVKAINRRNNLLCKLGLTSCLSDSDTQQQLRDLDTVLNYLISAKTTCEVQHQFTDSMNQYRYAISLMDKMDYNPRRC